jgi:arabinosaccharide transport system substrate-binding protein
MAMPFPLGKPILVMLGVAAASGVAILLRPQPKPTDLTMWVFADAHARAYRELVPEFERRTRRSARIELVTNLALNMRLTSLIMSADAGERPPDVVEVEIASIGRYFRAPADQVGFLPLNDRLAGTGWREIDSLDDPGKSGWNARLRSDGSVYTHDGSRWKTNPSRTRPDAWIDRIVRSRFAPWTKAGLIFGVPHDVHPVTITYRHDLFSEAGIDLGAAATWPQFQEMCLEFQRYWRGRGYKDRYAMELPLASAENVIVMLLQRGVNVVDSDDNIHVRDPKVAPTVAFYARLVAGRRRIGVESSGGMGVWARDLVDGNTCALITPDWKVADLKAFAPSLAGKLRMMPLPVFDPRDARTSTWGGTMAGIPRHCKDPDAAWRLLEYLYLGDDARATRRANGTILPPLPEEYDRPEYQRPEPYFGGQKADALYAQLATEIPPRYVSPLTVAGQIAVGVVLGRAVDYIREHGNDAGLEAACADWLREAEAGLRARLAHGRIGGD